jgi:hypothetical protein
MQPRARRGDTVPKADSRPRRRPLQQFEIIDGNSKSGAEFFKLLPKRSLAMVLLLPLHVPLNRPDSIGTDRKRSEPTLPTKPRNTVTKPVSGRFLQFTDDAGERMRRTEASDEMKVIFHAAGMNISYAEIARRTGDVGVKVRPRGAIEKRLSIPRRENDVDVNV